MTNIAGLPDQNLTTAPPMSEDLLRLAERVEALDGPSDTMDLAIATWCYRNGAVAGVNYDPEMWVIRNGGEFTASIDAAMTLVPKGAMRRSGDSAVGLMGTFFCDIVTEDGRDFHALANNEPCAIVAAALRASIGKGE